MTPPFPTTFGGIRRRAFTLLELLVVLAIMGILLILAIVAIGPLMQSYNLNRASSMISDEFNFARQTALTKNADVEIRFYQIPSANGSSDLQFRAFRTFLANPSSPAQAVPLDKISYLPGQIVISTNVAFSTLLDYGNSSRFGLITSHDTLPGASTANAFYVSFTFRATGGTGLTPIIPPLGIWDMALYAENSPKKATGLPSNFVTIQVDPVTGNTQTYRP